MNEERYETFCNIAATAIGLAADAWAAGEGCDDIGVLDPVYCRALAKDAILPIYRLLEKVEADRDRALMAVEAARFFMHLASNSDEVVRLRLAVSALDTDNNVKSV
jgi:hypothetical protein